MKGICKHEPLYLDMYCIYLSSAPPSAWSSSRIRRWLLMPLVEHGASCDAGCLHRPLTGPSVREARDGTQCSEVGLVTAASLETATRLAPFLTGHEW